MIYVFNHQGTYCGHIGSIGHGHGEYINPRTFYLDDNRKVVDVVDAYSNSILQYDFNGTFLSSKEVKQGISAIYQYGYLADGKVLGCNCIFTEPSDVYFVADSALTDTIYTLSSELNSDAMTPVGNHPFTIRNNTAKMCLPFSNIIYEYANGEFKEFAHIETKLNVLNEKEIRDTKFTMPINMSTVPVNDDVFWGFSDLFETDKFIVLNTPYDSYFIIEKGKTTGKRYINYSYEQVVYKHLPLINLSSAKDNILIGISTAESLKDWVALDSSSKDPNMKKFKKIIKNLPYKDVPVILMYQLKSI